MKQYVWLDLTTGKFSNSWTEEENKKYISNDTEMMKKANEHNWKLIEYSCVNDENFNFCNQMKIK